MRRAYITGQNKILATIRHDIEIISLDVRMIAVSNIFRPVMDNVRTYKRMRIYETSNDK